uniref:Uncharacterized protein n=1 Tax=Caenorhabditis japonica TaxID=281687 RepID=A0A8R1EGQ2_CAEJA
MVNSQNAGKLVKRSNSVEVRKATRGTVPVLPAKPISTTANISRPPRSLHTRKNSLKFKSNLGRGDMPPVPEHPVEETWQQIKELTDLLLEMRPCHVISREEVEGHVKNVWMLIE